MIYVVQQGDRLPQLAQRFGGLPGPAAQRQWLGTRPAFGTGAGLDGAGSHGHLHRPARGYAVGYCQTDGGPPPAAAPVQPHPDAGAPSPPGGGADLSLGRGAEGSLSVGGYAYPHVLPPGVAAGTAVFDHPLRLFPTAFRRMAPWWCRRTVPLLAEAQRFRVVPCWF